MVDFTSLIIGIKYSRPQLADLWGYRSYNAISRGVVTPQGMNLIILFITKEKQESLTQYIDHIEHDRLFWEGEKKHGSDNRIIQRKDEIHVFYRDRHHSDFSYEGRAVLNTYLLMEDQPSKFTFTLIDRQESENDIVAEIESQYGGSKTEREAIIQSRIGQGFYRRRSIELWGRCSVTSFSKTNILIASHIKPWKYSDNVERINPYNSLLLVPTIDKLFDKGYIGFDSNGRIMLSERISDSEYQKINITKDLSLRSVPSETKDFLDYHSEYIFNMMED
ncbi:MAG: HNH endonuclease signature motif containing protein [Spirochaetales bacterium]|nr:HNH endonuclease signature motif containing protein [Spirochaetales bacterium]